MNSNNEALADFPFEIIAVILLMLPVRSLCRFKCVSKAWFGLISAPKFAKEHVDLNKEQRKEKLFFVLESGYWFSLDLKFPFLTGMQISHLGECLSIQSIWGSCDGLLLLEDLDKSIFLVNPSIRECLQLSVPLSLYNLDEIIYGLGYDSSTDDYKVVQISKVGPDFGAGENMVKVYNLRANTWRRIKSPPHRLSVVSDSTGVFVNGALHWLCHSEIIALDLASERIHSMPLPGSGGVVLNIDLLYVIGDCLCGFEIDYCYDLFHVWVMKEYGVRDSWVKFTVDVIESFSSVDWVLPLRSGNLILHARSILGYYDVENCKIDAGGLKFPAPRFATTYQESLLRLLKPN